MDVGERLRQFRKLKGFSHGKIEECTGMLPSYISRVENGHTVPSVEILERFARALDVPLYQLLYEGEKPPEQPTTQAQRKMSVPDRALLFHMAAKMAGKKRRT